MLHGHGFVDKKIIEFSGLQEGNQVGLLGSHVPQGSPGSQLCIEPGHLVVFLRQLPDKLAPVPAGVAVGVGMAVFHAFSQENAVPVLPVDLLCIF